MAETLGQVVKRLRKQQGDISQGRLAEQSGLSISLINKIERDRLRGEIRRSTLERLADGLGLGESSDRQLLVELALKKKELPKTSDLLGPIPLMPPNDNVPQNSEYDLSKPCVFTQMEDVAGCVLQMLKKASELGEGNAGELLVTTMGGSSIFLSLDKEDRWKGAIDKTMEQKWNVASLYRLTGDMQRALEVIREVRHLSGWPEQYTARYFRQIGVLRPAYNLLIVPQVGALLCLSTHNSDVVDAAFFYPDNPKSLDRDPYISSLTNHFNLLFIETVQLARTYDRHSTEWEETLTATTALESPEYLANNCVELWNMPPDLYDKFLEESLRRENIYSSMEFRRLQAHHSQRRDAFVHNIKNFTYRTIMPRRSIEDALGLITGECRYPVEYASPPQYVTVKDKKQAFAHINNIIDDLKRYDNYEIALIEEEHSDEDDLLSSPYLVKGDKSVLTAIYKKDIVEGYKFASKLEITEPSIVRAYFQLFLNSWNDVAEADKTKQKEKVIGKLNELLKEAGYKPEISRG